MIWKLQVHLLQRSYVSLKSNTSWRNWFALRCLLDQARDNFAVDCQCGDWGDMAGKVGAESLWSELLIDNVDKGARPPKRRMSKTWRP